MPAQAGRVVARRLFSAPDTRVDSDGETCKHPASLRDLSIDGYLFAAAAASRDLDQRLSTVELRGISKWFDRRGAAPLLVLENVDLTVATGTITAIVGESGCGKSTLLNIIAGLLQPDRGTLRLNDTAAEAFRGWRSMTYMFQEDRLLPWRTAAANGALGLESAGVGRSERRERVAATLALVGLTEFANAYPHALSGGMRSRVALARSIVTEPSILLMDEPFSKLDPSIRSQMHGELLRIAALRAMTVIFVTHDVEEAVVLADHVVVMHPRPGRVRETRAVTLPYPRDPVSPNVAEQVRSLRLVLSGLASAPELQLAR